MARSVTDIQTDLDTAHAAQRLALMGQEYTLDTGQGRQSVKRGNLADIRKVINDLESELEEAENIGTGMIRMGFER